LGGCPVPQLLCSFQILLHQHGGSRTVADEVFQPTTESAYYDNGAAIPPDSNLLSVLPPTEVIINLCDTDDEYIIPNKPPAPQFFFDLLALGDVDDRQQKISDSSHYTVPDFLDYDRTYMSLRVPKRKKTNPSIDFNVKKPVYTYKHIPIYECD
jgi:hypothetical protein